MQQSCFQWAGKQHARLQLRADQKASEYIIKLLSDSINTQSLPNAFSFEWEEVENSESWRLKCLHVPRRLAYRCLHARLPSVNENWNSATGCLNLRCSTHLGKSEGIHWFTILRENNFSWQPIWYISQMSLEVIFNTTEVQNQLQVKEESNYGQSLALHLQAF